MTPLQRLRALLDASTKGPWKCIKALQKEYKCVAFSCRRDEPYTTSPLLPADAAFIVEARNQMDRLLAVAEAAERATEGVFEPGAPTPLSEWFCPEKITRESMRDLRDALRELQSQRGEL